MTPSGDSHWPPDVTPEEMRRVEDFERRTAMTDITKTYLEEQEDILREKFGRRLDEAELTALTNINVTIKRSEAGAQESGHGSAAGREYRGSRTDKYGQTRPQEKLERFSRTLVRSKQDTDAYARETSRIVSDRNSKGLKRTSEGAGKKYKDKKTKRSRSNSASSGSSSRSRSSSGERSGHKPAKTKSSKGERGKKSDGASNVNSGRPDSRGHKKLQESHSRRSQSPKRSSSSRGSRRSSSRSR